LIPTRIWPRSSNNTQQRYLVILSPDAKCSSLIVGDQAAREAGAIIAELLATREDIWLQGAARREAQPLPRFLP
jgi:hypothetical protein